MSERKLNMAERNRDKIKRLEHELGRYQKKVGDQQKEVNGLKKQIQAAEDGAHELGMIVDALMAGVAMKYGEVREDGAWEMTVPLLNVRKIGGKYAVEARVSDDNDSYTVRVTEREGGSSE